MSMKLYQDASPGVVGVPLKLFPQEPGSYPYESAVQELKLLITDCCPQRKLECIGESDCVDCILTHTEVDFQDRWLLLECIHSIPRRKTTLFCTITSDFVLTLIRATFFSDYL